MARATEKSELNESLVRRLARLLDETNLSEIEYGRDGWHIRVARRGVVETVPAAPVAVPAPAAGESATAQPVAETAGQVIKSPMVGVVFTSPEPGMPPFVQVGDTVKTGQTLLLIEAMKVFNPITAPRGGRVAGILVSNGAPVEFDEPLLIIE